MRTFVTVKKADVRLAIRLIGELQTHEKSTLECHSPNSDDSFERQVVLDAQMVIREAEDLVKRLEAALEAKR